MAELLRCSFCNRSQKETRALVDGPGVRICNECISLCAELIGAEDRRDAVEPSSATAAPDAVKEVDTAAIDRAIAELLPLVEKDPDDLVSLLRLGDLFERKGQSLEAARHYGRVAALYTRQDTPHKAIAVYQKMLELALVPKGIHSRIGGGLGRGPTQTWVAARFREHARQK